MLRKNGVKVISAKETIAEGSEGILLESVLEGMAEYYSAELAEKVTRGMKENALKGLWNGGNVPFGYVINNERKLDIDPQAAPVIQEIFKLCNDGKTVKEIYRIMNERKVTRSNGKALRYNAIRYMLSNRVYIGEYHHMGVVIENSVPQLISEELFDAVQLELAKNSKAPAKHTADEDYLLTTKLFCGRCGAMMVAQAGTSGTKGVVYRYYACVRQKKHQCEKKPVSKTKLEDFIVYKTMEFLKDDDIIERLSAKLYELQYTESTILPKLQEQLKQKEKEIENIVNAVQKGYATETLLKRLDGLEKQKREISDVIAKEQLKSPIFSQDHFKMALSNFRKIDITTQEGKRKIIDTFINAIYLYGDHLKIIYNANGKEETISLAELESSTLFSRGAPTKQPQARQGNPCRACGVFYALQHFRQKVFEPFVLRVAEDLLRRALLLYLAAVHKEDARRHFARKAHLVRDDDHGHALVRKLFDEFEHFAHHFRVERGRRFVEQHHLRVHRKRAHDGDTLALPARKGGRVHVRLIRKPDTGEKAHRVLFCRGFDLFRARLHGQKFPLFLFAAEQIRDFAEKVFRLGLVQVVQPDVHGRERDVFEHVHVVEQVELLEHHAHAAAVQVDVDLPVYEVRALEVDGAARRILQHVQTAQKSALAAARRPDDGDLFALLDLVGNIVQHGQLAEFLGEVLYLDEGDMLAARKPCRDGRIRLCGVVLCRLLPCVQYGNLRFNFFFHSCAASFPRRG